MNLPVRMSCSQSISETRFDVLDPVAGCKGISYEGDPSLAGLDGRKILDVVAATGAVGVPMARDPAFANPGEAQRVGCINEEPKKDFAPQEHKRKEENQNKPLPQRQADPGGRAAKALLFLKENSQPGGSD